MFVILTSVLQKIIVEVSKGIPSNGKQKQAKPWTK